MAQAYNKVYFGDRVVDEAQAGLKITSSAVLYGLSVYTVFPVCVTDTGKRAAFRLPEHFARLCNSAHIIGIDTFAAEWSYQRFAAAVGELLAATAPTTDVFVRATVHVTSDIAGTRSRGLATTLSMFVYPAETILHPKGTRLKTSFWRRVPDYAIPARAKVNGAYVNSVLGKQDALDSGYDDCIFLDGAGHVCELSAANIFVVREGVVITPDAPSDLLEGINRRSVIELVRQRLDLPVVERAVDLTELYIADEVFATGTSANIAPIIEIDARRIATGKPGPVTKQLQTLHADLIHGKLPDYTSFLTML
jgi:branched-chain amino acid aminotransferase